ncbi:hypothetical protein [Streptomyces sp. NPDC059378]|uniref:hypothetical protein n=1 Tax=Streptomyces sp. NPDC059378 TaxID=3346815 RepID=UPI003687CE0C
MSRPDTRRLDREIQRTTRKLEAVRKGELWPLTGQERRAMLRAVAGGSYRVLREQDPGRAERRIDQLSTTAEIRLTAELTALHTERQRVINEHAAAKAAKKSKGWW